MEEIVEYQYYRHRNILMRFTNHNPGQQIRGPKYSASICYNIHHNSLISFIYIIVRSRNAMALGQISLEDNMAIISENEAFSVPFCNLVQSLL